MTAVMTMLTIFEFMTIPQDDDRDEHVNEWAVDANFKVETTQLAQVSLA